MAETLQPSCGICRARGDARLGPTGEAGRATIADKRSERLPSNRNLFDNPLVVAMPEYALWIQRSFYSRCNQKGRYQRMFAPVRQRILCSYPSFTKICTKRRILQLEMPFVHCLASRNRELEQVVKALEGASVVGAAYGHKDQSKVFKDDAVRVREGLVNAVRTAHPAYRDDIAKVLPSCIKFLSSFGKIFTLNYDLLLYWVILGQQQFADGFGLGTENNGFLGPFKTNARCNIFHVHGGLHLYKTADYEIEKRLATAAGLIDAIAETIGQGDRFPVYVAEGTSSAKLSRIKAIPHLKHCYQQLYDCTGALFVYGHSASDNDAHIYNALFSSAIDHIYFCIYKPRAGDLAEMNGKLSYFQKSNGSRIGYTFVDAESAAVWK